MNIKYDKSTELFIIDTQTLHSSCQTCGLYIGSIEIIKGSESLQYTLSNHICKNCFDEYKLRRIEAKIVK